MDGSRKKLKFCEIANQSVFLRSMWSYLNLLTIENNLVCRRVKDTDTGLEDLFKIG